LIGGGLILAFALAGIPMLPSLEQKFKQGRLDMRILRSKWQWLLAGSGAVTLLLFRMTGPGADPVEVPLFLVGIACFAVAVAAWDHQRHIDLSPHVSRRDLLWILGLFIAGIIIGAYRLQGLPDQLMADEGSFWTTARDIANNTLHMSIFASGVYTFPILSSIIQAWFLKIFGVDLWGWRFGSVVTGLATLAPLYLLAREMFDRRIAILSSIVLVTSPYFIDFSRLGYNNIQALFFTTLTLYWLYLGLSRKSSLHLYLAGCMAGFGFYTYFAARSALAISLGFILLIWLGKRIRFPGFLHAILLLGLGFAVVATPYFVYGRIHDAEGMAYKSLESAFFNSYNGLQFYSRAELFSVAPPVQIGDNELFYNPKIYSVLVVRGFIRTLLVLQKPGIISEHYIAFPLTGTLGVVFYLVGLILTLWTARQSRSLLILLWFFISVFGLSALNTVPPRQAHLIVIIPALALLTGIGLNAIATAAATMHFRLSDHRRAILIGLVGLAAAGGLYDYFARVPIDYRAQPNQIISWAMLDSNKEDFVYVYSDPSEKDFVPYAKELRKTVPYETVSLADVTNGVRNFASQPTLIFYSPGMAKAVRPALEKLWGESLISRTFYSTESSLVLLAGMNTPFTFEMDKGPLAILKDSYLNPGLDIFLLILIGCFSLAAFLPANLNIKFPPSLYRLRDWFSARAVKPFRKNVSIGRVK
jgi:4-amino-4-deoxy-L-arabinose transferase-like glycosyltransferase